MKLFYDNQVDIANVFSDEASVNYPASNVQNTRLSRFFRGDKSINFDITGAGGIKHIYQEFTNLVQDPTDLTTGNWFRVNTDTPTDSGQTINGEILWKVQGNVAGGWIFTSIPADEFTLTSPMFNVTVRRGNYRYAEIIIHKGPSYGGAVAILTIDFDTQTIIDTYTTIKKQIWIDDDTVTVYVTTNPIVLNEETRFLLSNPNDAGATATDYSYWTMPQAIDSTTMFPFVDGTHSADVIDETFTMPDKFIIRLKNIEPRFLYTTSNYHLLFTWHLSSNQFLELYYYPTDDTLVLEWKDNDSARRLVSQQFDDGSSFTNINQKLDIIVFLNLSSGGINDSMFIIIPQESGSIFIDNSFSGTPDVKESDFPTLSNGWDGISGLQADSNYELSQVYEWDGDKPTITSSDDADDYLVDKKILLDKTYMKRLTATDLLIANTTINAGDTITLRANDVDSFGSGSPVDESIDYDGSDILTHNFTKASYQYWRLIVNSSNVIDFGRVFLGLGYSTPIISYDVSHSYQSGTIKTRTPVGVTYGDIRIKENLISIKWPKILTATDKPDLITFFNQVDISKPFFLTFDDSVSLLGTFYVTIDTNGLHFVYYRNAVYSKAAISFIEEIG